MMALWLGLAARAAELEPSFAADPFRPALDGAGLAVQGAGLPERVEGRVTATFAMRPLIAWTDQTHWDAVVESATTAHASAAGRLGPVALGLDLPLGGVWLPDQDRAWTAGDPMLSARLAPWSERSVRRAVELRLTAPLGGAAVWAGYTGATAELLLLGDARMGAWFGAANLGLRGQPEARLGTSDGSVTLAGAGVARLALGRELGAGAASIEALASGAGEPQTTPLELLGVLTRHGAHDNELRLGAGVGVLPGVGAPLFRLVVGVGHRVADPPVDQPGGGS